MRINGEHKVSLRASDGGECSGPVSSAEIIDEPGFLYSNAIKYGFKKVEEVDRQRWLDMGMISLTFVAWTNEEGVITTRV